jgi:hypothetical protein
VSSEVDGSRNSKVNEEIVLPWQHGSALSVKLMRAERARKLESAGRGGTGRAGSATSSCMQPACI